MAIYRVKKDRDYSIVANGLIKSQRLSMKAKWALQTCLSMPDDWVFNIRGLCHYCMEGPDVVRSAIKELEDKGHIVRRRERNKGRLGRMIYDIYEDPSLNPNYTAQALPAQDKPVQAKPQTDHPAEAATHLHNTDHTNKIINNIYHTNYQSINQDAAIEDQIRKQIEYEVMSERYDSRMLDDLVAVMVSVMIEQSIMTTVSKTKSMPTDYVRACMNKITALHVEQIMDTLQMQQPVVRNMHSYLLTALINAANTMSMSYQYGDY